MFTQALIGLSKRPSIVESGPIPHSQWPCLSGFPTSRWLLRSLPQLSRTRESSVGSKVGTFFFLVFRAILWHMEVPGLGVQSELQLPAYTTATIF